MSSPRTAFLILAHKDPAQLVRLVNALSAPWAVCFVHISRKIPRAPFDEALADLPNCFLLPDEQRVVIHWGCYGIFEAARRLARYAVAVTPEVGRFCFLSGVDYPIQPMSVIGERMATDVEYLRIDRQVNAGRARDIHDDNVTYAYLGGSDVTNPRTGHPYLVRWASRISRRIRLRAPAGLDVYQGSFWCALTRGAMDEVLRSLDAFPKYLRWFKRIRFAEEVIIHTMIKRSAFSRKIFQDATVDEPRRWARHLWATHYINWEDANPQRPRTLVEDDFDDMLRSGALFGRKMDKDLSKGLLDLLDRYRSQFDPHAERDPVGLYG